MYFCDSIELTYRHQRDLVAQLVKGECVSQPEADQAKSANEVDAALLSSSSSKKPTATGDSAGIAKEEEEEEEGQGALAWIIW